MNLLLDTSVGSRYKSQTQRMRVITEKWITDNMYCPICGKHELFRYENNRPVADFNCKGCMMDFELKSRNTSRPHTLKKFSDGAYDTMIQRITEFNNPTFFFMVHYASHISDLFIVPNHFFTPAIIEKRKPLSDNARRAGWVGCNINIAGIPEYCKTNVVKNSSEINKTYVLHKFRQVQSLQIADIAERGWLIDVLNCLDKIQDKDFSIKEMYSFENELQTKHPENHFVKEKIRQQLQILRDRGFIEFTDRGHYRKTI